MHGTVWLRRPGARLVWRGALCLCLAWLCGPAAQAKPGSTGRSVVATPILDVPFISQREESCGKGCNGMNNCLPASLAMVLKAYGCQPPGGDELAFVHKMREVIDAANKCDQLGTDFRQATKALPKMTDPGLVACSTLSPTLVPDHAATTVQDVQIILDRVAAGNPAIVAVSALRLQPRQVKTSAFSKDGKVDDRHVLVVTGADQERVYVNDPLYYRYVGACRPAQGAWYYTRASFVEAVVLHGDGALFIGSGPPQPLRVTQNLTLLENARPGQPQEVRCKVRNNSSQMLTLQKLMVSGRGPQEPESKRGDLNEWLLWQAPEVDWTAAGDVQLAPGQEYEYVQSRSFDQEGIYFAVLSYWDAAGTWHTLTGPAVFNVSSSAPSQDDAALVGKSPSPRMPPGSETTVAVTLRNTGAATWAAGQGYALRHVGGLAPSSAGEVPVGSAVPVGGEFRTVMRFKAPASAGTYPSEWQMVHGDEPFGPRVTVQLRVEAPGPGGPGNWWDQLMESIRRQMEALQDSALRQIEAWQRQMQAYLDEQVARLQRQIQEGVQREVERQLKGLCGSGLLVPGLLLGASLWLSGWTGRRRR